MLAYERIQTQENPTHYVILLHGILGSKQNMKGFAQQLVRMFPCTQVLLVDLPHHGDSKIEGSTLDLYGCASQVLALADFLQFPVDVLMGHSFGGKVVLACSALRKANQVWILDAVPGIIPKTPAAIKQVLDVLRQIKPPLASRQAVKEQMQALGLSSALSAWMTTNLQGEQGSLEWKVDVQRIEEMLKFYQTTDFWPLLESNPNGVRYDFVRAAKENRFSVRDVEKLEELQEKNFVYLHLLENAGHWVHIDNPSGLLKLFQPFLS